jgi:hypothetical protein
VSETRPEGHIAHPPSAGGIALLTLGALTVASAIVVLFVLPAEFHRDPTGFGKLTGIDQLAGPEIVNVADLPAEAGTAARYYDAAFRSDTIEIALQPEDKGMNDLEYKVKMKPGGTLTYSWTVSGDEDHPDWFYFDFHGESRPIPAGQTQPTVVEYRQATGISSSGALVAPFEGIHGWYLQNQSDKPVVVHLKLAGFYELVPPGEYGNEAGIEPMVQASAR